MKVVNRTKLPEKVPYSTLDSGEMFIFTSCSTNVFMVCQTGQVPVKVVEGSKVPHPDLRNLHPSTMVYKVQLKHVEFDVV